MHDARTGRLSRPALHLALTLALVAVPLAADAAQPEPSTTERIAIAQASTQEDLFSWPASFAATLSQRAVGEALAVEAFPVAPGVRMPLTFERVEIYAAGARIWSTDGRSQVEIPRSPRIYFQGSSLAEPATRVTLSVDPEGGLVRGTVFGPRGTFGIASAATQSQPDLYRIAASEVPEELDTRCGADSLDHRADDPFPLGLAGIEPPLFEGSAPTRQIVIAVDSDNEWLHLRFANNTAAATTWLADLFATMNVMYERDLALRLLLGETIFRLDTDVPPTYDDDPWTVSGGVASGAHLSEFGSFWSANQGAVDRTFAMLLSGKSSANNSSSGIAWVDGYCETQSTGGGYSVTMVFKSIFPVEFDARVIGHEIGHNAGSPHTHCYNPPVDECYALEAGCYTGPVSCPTAGTGTLMSYCNFSTGANCGQNRLELHPTVITNIDGFLNAHSPFCVAPIDAIFEDGFESGNTSAWSSIVP